MGGSVKSENLVIRRRYNIYCATQCPHNNTPFSIGLHLPALPAFPTSALPTYVPARKYFFTMCPHHPFHPPTHHPFRPLPSTASVLAGWPVVAPLHLYHTPPPRKTYCCFQNFYQFSMNHVLDFWTLMITLNMV